MNIKYLKVKNGYNAITNNYPTAVGVGLSKKEAEQSLIEAINIINNFKVF